MQGIPAVWHAGETELRTLGPDDLDFARAVGVISTDAYPVLNVPAGERDAFVAKMRDAMRADPMRTYIGAYRGGELVGCMQHWDFKMRVRGVQCRTGGLGSVAVDFVHKRRGVARDLVRGFLDRTQRSGARGTLSVPAGLLSCARIWIWNEDRSIPREDRCAAGARRSRAREANRTRRCGAGTRRLPRNAVDDRRISLMMGATRLPSLVRYGRARLTQPAQLAELDAAFTTDPPQCKTAF